MTDVIETTVVDEPDATGPEESVSTVPAIPGDPPLMDPVPVGAASRSVVPAEQEMRTLAAMANAMAVARVGVPKALWDKPNDVFAVFLTARDLGMALTTALREFHVIEGKVTLSPKIRLAATREIGRSRGWKIWPDPDNDREGAVWWAQRAEYPGLTFSSEYTWADAQEAELVSWDCTPTEHTAACRAKPEWVKGSDGKSRLTSKPGICKDNWRKYPARMLSWRAVGYLLDDQFGEVGQGLYSPDELGAITDEEGSPIIDVSEVKAPEGMGRKAAPAAPGVAVASQEARDVMAARIAALPEGGRQALREWWAVVKENGETRRPLGASTQADMIAINGAVTGIERRAAAGEWGDPGSGPLAPPVPDAPPETPLETPVVDDPPVDVPDVPEPAPVPTSAPDGPGMSIAAQVRVEVEQMDNDTVAEYLTAMEPFIAAEGIPYNRETKSWLAKRAILRVALEAERIKAANAETAE